MQTQMETLRDQIIIQIYNIYRSLFDLDKNKFRLLKKKYNLYNNSYKFNIINSQIILFYSL